MVSTKNAVLYGNNSVDANGKTTFVFYFTNKSSGTVLSGFNIKTNTDYALVLNNVNKVNIANNNITGGDRGSIYLEGSNHINITKNTIKNSGGSGVTIESSRAVTLYNNLILNNQGDGVSVLNSQVTNLTLNRIYFSGLNGITLNQTNNTVIHNSSINNNNGEGISLFNTNVTSIWGNNITNNILNGLLLEGWTTQTNAFLNYLIHNLNGIYVDSVSYDDHLVSNYIIKSHYTSNTKYDIFYTGNGIKFGDNYVKTDKKIDVHSNTLFANDNFEIQGNSNYDKIDIGANYYGTNDKWACGVCPMINTDMLKAKVVNGVNGFELIFYQPSNANQQVTNIIDQAVNWTVSTLNPDGTTTQIMNVLGQIKNGTSFLNFTRDKNKTYIGTAIINGVEYSFQWDPDNNTDQPDNNGTSHDPGNSNSTGTGNNTNGNGGTNTNGTGGPTNSNGTGNGKTGTGTSSTNGTPTGSGKDLTQVGFEGASANNGGQQSAGDSSSSTSGVEVAIKNAINKTVTNPFNNLGIIALLGLIGIGYFKRDKFK